jgi:UDP-N-acetylglucosamine/UDP-N-acetylgalactosamine diphosphorylase
MNIDYERVLETLIRHHQAHLLHFYSQLSEASQQKLLKQILLIDWGQLEAALESLDRLMVPGNAPYSSHSALALDSAEPTILTNPVAAAASLSLFSDFMPITAYSWDTFSAEEQHSYEEKGWKLLRQGKVGAVVVAGGQGSRLGHDGPKGTYDIGLPSHKSLFQLQAERLTNLSLRAESHIPWYIMTSPDNHKETVQYFSEAEYFGYGQENCMFVQQSVMPAVDGNGRILLSAKDEISLTPSGNGECFAVLERAGALADMKRRGVEWLFYYNVDNALIKVADPKFVGVAAHFNHPIATKVVEKISADEKVGIIGMNKNRPTVVEYSDLPQYLMEQRDEEGKLVYGLGNISIHLFRRDWIETQVNRPVPYHPAHKKIKQIDEFGCEVEGELPNGYKFEKFIFDYFPLAAEITVLHTPREGEFAPVKNKAGIDSPESARALVLELHRSWLLQAGAASEQLKHPVEVSPLISYSGEGLGNKQANEQQLRNN